jgi:hypothetical protein
MIALSKVVKRIWRRVSKGQLGSHEMAGKCIHKQGRIVRDADEHDMDLVEEEIVWDDEGRVRFPEDISQTETLRDRSSYSWSTVIRTIRRDGGENYS